MPPQGLCALQAHHLRRWTGNAPAMHQHCQLSLRTHGCETDHQMHVRLHAGCCLCRIDKGLHGEGKHKKYLLVAISPSKKLHRVKKPCCKQAGLQDTVRKVLFKNFQNDVQALIQQVDQCTHSMCCICESHMPTTSQQPRIPQQNLTQATQIRLALDRQ